jgi:hypothetical protein
MSLVAIGVVALVIAVWSPWGTTVAGQAPASAVRSTAPKGWTPPKTSWGHPDLQGVWDQTTGTPLERPTGLASKETLSEEEAVAREQTRFAGFDATPRKGATGDYGSQWRDSSRNGLTRTSLVVDPPDGRIPPLTPAAQKMQAMRRERTRLHPADSWTDRNLWERCITRGVPRIPNNYNSNWHILQTPGYVVILNEMIHETRVIPLDARPHGTIRQWGGDSRGRWDGNTLVIDTINFDDKQEFNGFKQSSLHLVERVTRIDANTLDYQFTVEDPAIYTRPWTVALPLTRTDNLMFEYACHEGNHGMVGILAGHRAQEKTESR